MIGVGILVDEIPLYFDGMNEWGLFAAALNFSGYAQYGNLSGKKSGISSSDLIGFLLGFCKHYYIDSRTQFWGGINGFKKIKNFD